MQGGSCGCHCFVAPLLNHRTTSCVQMPPQAALQQQQQAAMACQGRTQPAAAGRSAGIRTRTHAHAGPALVAAAAEAGTRYALTGGGCCRGHSSIDSVCHGDVFYARGRGEVPRHVQGGAHVPFMATAAAKAAAASVPAADKHRRKHTVLQLVVATIPCCIWTLT
jgi:hypothetical protein